MEGPLWLKEETGGGTGMDGGLEEEDVPEIEVCQVRNNTLLNPPRIKTRSKWLRHRMTLGKSVASVLYRRNLPFRK